MGLKILITGGAGYLGSVLTQKLLLNHTQSKYKSKSDTSNYDQSSHDLEIDKIIVYDNLMYRQVCLTDFCYRKDFEFVYGDVRDENKLRQYLKDVDVIIPLAAIVGFPACEKDKRLATEINFEQINFILKNTSRQQKIIYPNTNSGYGIGKDNLFCDETTELNPISHYGVTKCMAEKMLLDNRRAITLRLATVFGVSPRMRLDLLVNDFVYKAVNDGYLMLFEKHFKRNFIHIHDVALTFISMINRYEEFIGQTFNVGLSSANINKEELALKIKEQIPSLVIKDDNFKEDPDKRNYIVSNKKLEDTGWKAYYSLDDGISELIKAYQIISNNNRNFTNL